MIKSQISDNKRIAKNTLLLYGRMIITIILGLFTSRLVLQALGENDYGIYSVVGGIITMFAFINSSLSGASQRFLNYEMGHGSLDDVRNVFKTSVQLHISVSLLVLILGETVGLWFLNTCMNIAPERKYAANWVYQFSVFSCVLSIITVPYNALIIAYEKMGPFAYFSLIDVFLRLIVLWLLCFANTDRLIVYALALFLISLNNRVIYQVYCYCKLKASRVSLKGLDYPMIKSMTSFSGWTIVGSLGYMTHTEGIAILINIFFGTLVNAAQGITNQVNAIVTGFVTNFLIAMNPQVVKLYSAGKLPQMHTLVMRGCRYAFNCVMILAVPLIVATPTILKIWLPVVPPYTAIFIRLTLLITLFNSFTSLLAAAQGATGKIKVYQITLTSIGLLHLPIVWVMFYYGFSAYWSVLVYLVIVIVLQICRVMFVCKSINMNLRAFSHDVVTPCLTVTGVVFALTYMFKLFVIDSEIVNALISEGLALGLIWSCGITSKEKSAVVGMIKKKLKLSRG